MHATLADIIADTAQNSIEAGASKVSVSIVEDGERFSVSVIDNGKGMDDEIKKRAFDPFYTEPGKHDKRKVGLGLPILRQMCECCGGEVQLESEKGVGTRLHYFFEAGNIDLPPVGDLADTAVMLFNYPGDFELIFLHSRGGEEYSVARSELVEALGSLESVECLAMAKDFMRSQENSLPSPVTFSKIGR